MFEMVTIEQTSMNTKLCFNLRIVLPWQTAHNSNMHDGQRAQQVLGLLVWGLGRSMLTEQILFTRYHCGNRLHHPQTDSKMVRNSVEV